jgi:hypothetical protein
MIREDGSHDHADRCTENGLITCRLARSVSAEGVEGLQKVFVRLRVHHYLRTVLAW